MQGVASGVSARGRLGRATRKGVRRGACRRSALAGVVGVPPAPPIWCGVATMRMTPVQKQPGAAAAFSACSVRTLRAFSPMFSGRGGPPVQAEVELEVDASGRERVALKSEGWNYWEWRGHRCHYIVDGPANGKPVVLVHGFGAHAYHWRYTIPFLASQGYRVYAPCLLGYGWSAKVHGGGIRYSAELWGEHVADFMREVAGCGKGGRKAALAGNSIGSIAALYAAATAPELTRALVFVNAAGRFLPKGEGAPPVGGMAAASRAIADADADAEGSGEASEGGGGVVAAFKQLLGRLAAYGIFYSTRFRVRQILKQVYVDHAQVDDDLVESIERPAREPDARECFYYISQSSGNTRVDVNDLLDSLKIPLLLLWGEQDPWMTPEKASTIRGRYQKAQYAGFVGGHCPHDDSPEESNRILLDWLKSTAF